MTYGTSSESMEKMFDSNTGSKCATSSPSPTDSSLNDSTKWLVYCFRLPANANTPVSYNFYSGNDGNPERNAISWVLESSTDGIDWTVVDEKTQYTTGIPSGSSGWYNGGDAFIFGEEPPVTDPYATFGGQQYIMTDFKPDQDTRVVMDVDVANTKEYWFGAWNIAYNTGAFAAGNDDNGVYIGYDGQGGTLAPLVSNGRHTVEMDKNAWKVDGTAAHTFNYTTLSVNYNLVLFGQNRAGQVHIPSKSNPVKLYSAKIYDNGTLVRDFVPSVDSLGAEGLYESIESIFYYKDGTSQPVTPPDPE